MQIFAIVVSFALTVAAVALLVPAVRRMLGVIRSGPAGRRVAATTPAGRAVTMLKETFLHTRMLQWHWVGIMHWFVYAAFLFLSTAVLAAYFQLFKPDFAWPIIGHWYPFEWVSELIGLLSTVGIVFLIVYRQKHHPRTEGRAQPLLRLELLAGLLRRGARRCSRARRSCSSAARSGSSTRRPAARHYPISSWIGDALYSDVDRARSRTLIYFIAMFKIALAMIWLMVIARNITMGIAWHRFTAWFNICFKRESDGSTALGAMKPLTSDGQGDHPRRHRRPRRGLGARRRQGRGLLLEGHPRLHHLHRVRPLPVAVPRLEHREAAVPQAADHRAARPRVRQGATATRRHAERGSWSASAPRARAPAPAPTSSTTSTTPRTAPFVIDEDVLWNCTSCGACVQQCPVDIEHVDHIMDMRRYQVLVESNFPAELNQLFKGLENKGNPWNMSSTARMDWAKGLDFDVPVVGEDLESLESVDWLFWVGCAGAYEDRAKKTTRAVAELLNMAGDLLRRARQRRDLHRRPGPSRRQRVRLPGPGRSRTSRRSRSTRSRRSSRPAPTASTRSRTSTRTSASSSRSCTTRSCSTASCARAS